MIRTRFLKKRGAFLAHNDVNSLAKFFLDDPVIEHKMMELVPAFVVGAFHHDMRARR